MVEDQLGPDAEHPYDGTRWGSVCQQGNLNPIMFKFLNKLTIEGVVGLILKVRKAC